MSTIRYTLGGSYDLNNSAGATTLSEIDFSDQAYRAVGVSNGYDEYYVSGSAGGSLLFVAGGASLLRPSIAGIGVDFSDKTGFVFLTGGSLGDNLRAGSNYDTLNGGAGNDVLEGGAGSDDLDGGTGIDTASYEHAAARVLVALAAPQNNLGEAAGDSYLSIENVRGGDFDDELIGDGAANVLEGGRGADYIEGGGGGDTASYEHSASGVIADLSLVLGIQAATGAGDASGDQLVSISSLLGSANADFLTGNTNANILSGGAGNDTLDGGAGADTYYGGDGNDILSDFDGNSMDRLYGGDGDDRITVNFVLSNEVFDGGAGYDTLDLSSDSYSFRIVLGSSFGALLANFNSFEAYIGGTGQDEVIGSDDGNRIEGRGGGDSLEGRGGDDTLIGGAGSDTLNGGTGFDTASYESSSAGVTVDLTLTTAQSSAGEAAGDILIDIENVTGSGLNDSLTGNDGANVLRGSGGADFLNGGLGDDYLIITDDGSSVHGGGGTDKLLLQSSDTFMFADSTFSDIDYVYVAKGATLDLSAISLGVSISSQSAVGTSVTITGTQGADTIFSGKGTDLVLGGAGNDVIRGGSGYALLFGEDGIDTIRAGAGGARMDGGVGGDRLYGGAASDTFVFGADTGQDNVYNFQSGSDHLDVSALVDSFLDVNIRVLNGKDTLVTFDGVDPAIKFVLRGVSSVQEGDFDFGTQPTALAHHDWAV